MTVAAFSDMWFVVNNERIPFPSASYDGLTVHVELGVGIPHLEKSLPRLTKKSI